MPAFLFDSHDILPMPSLKAYTTVSVLLLSCSIYYAIQVTSEPDWKVNSTLGYALPLISQSDRQILEQHLRNHQLSDSMPWATEEEIAESARIMSALLTHPYVLRVFDITYLMLHEPLCIWTLINMAYCCLIMVGKVIQKFVFGELRVSEQQHIKDKFWNFVFYKFIFIFGVMNVQYMDEIVLWCSWFSLLGFLSLLAQLCKDRFVYLSFSPTTPKWTHVRLLLLLLGILASSTGLLLVGVFVGIHAGLSTFAIMAAECLLVSVRTLYVFVRYAIHLWDLNHEGVWENRSIFIYYTELVFEMIALVIDFFHYLHMLFCGTIFLSMASFVIVMQLRFLFSEIKRKLRKHKNYLQVVRLMEQNFPMATSEELVANSDDCAICWDKMDTARKLPCGHLFHNFCLRSWLEQDTSCPTCRTSLKNRTDSTDANGTASTSGGGDPSVGNNGGGGDGLVGGVNGLRGVPIGGIGGVGGIDNIGDNRDNAGVRNHFYHFDFSRYLRGLPTVSVEVSRMNVNIGLVTRNTQPNASSTSMEDVVTQTQLEAMARQVLEAVPTMPFAMVMEDLRQTRSVNETLENILDGHLVAPPLPPQEEQPSTSSHSDQEISESSDRGPSLVETELRKREGASSSTQQESINSKEPESSSSSSSSSLPTTSTNPVEQVECPCSKTYASDFADNTSERDRSFQERKKQLYDLARKSFLAKHSASAKKDHSSSSSTASSFKKD